MDHQLRSLCSCSVSHLTIQKRCRLCKLLADIFILRCYIMSNGRPPHPRQRMAAPLLLQPHPSQQVQYPISTDFLYPPSNHLGAAALAAVQAVTDSLVSFLPSPGHHQRRPLITAASRPLINQSHRGYFRSSMLRAVNGNKSHSYFPLDSPRPCGPRTISASSTSTRIIKRTGPLK